MRDRIGEIIKEARRQHISHPNIYADLILSEFEKFLEVAKTDSPIMLSISENEHYIISINQWNACIDSIKRKVRE